MITRHIESHNFSSSLRAAIDRLHPLLGRWKNNIDLYSKALRLEAALGLQNTVVPGEAWADAAITHLKALQAPEHTAWNALLEHAQTATAARPSASWHAAAHTRLEDVGQTAFRSTVCRWLALAEAAETAAHRPRHADQLRGLVWYCSLLPDAEIARSVGDLGVACYKKIPGLGARSVKVGNACIYALGAMDNQEAVAQLTRLRMRVKDRRGRNAIDAALENAAARHGLSPDDLEEIAVPTFGLDDGVLQQPFGDYTARLRITGTARTTLRWRRPDGKIQKSIPAAVKRAHTDALRTLRKTARDLRAILSAQRDRLERLLRTERTWPLAAWRSRYPDHPLLASMARRLIWQIAHDGTTTLAIHHDGRLVDINDRPVDALPETAQVRLWHPILSDAATIQAWRCWLEDHHVTQPFKQAHREVYLLTDAERQTGTYSNRFAAHILHQHQFAALCRARGWRYTLQGAFDSWNAPVLDLPQWGLRAFFNAEAPNGTDFITEMGIFLYVTTDQVRFHPMEEGRAYEPLSLDDVPPLAFSEVMRDVDLFVGVSSVGNDPAWTDRGENGAYLHFTDYWQDYSFGALSTSAQTRKDVLTRLLPRLAIADRCRLDDRFLIVHGDLRTYKIHLRSANILMTPNDQYLCIVPNARALSRTGADTLFLPFEGDRTLSLILSKAVLLANDTAIKDPTIMRQIK